MNSGELISVIVPIYNVEKYISRCIETIINQTYKNLEIILIDDGSTDRSGDICDEYANKDKRIRVIHKENEGPSDARNSGLSVATGEYISFIDSDDWIALNMYEILHAAIDTEKADLAFGVTQRSSGNSSYNIPDDSQIILAGNDILESFIYPWHNPHILKSVWDKLYRRDIIGNIKFIKGMVHGEDAHFTLEILSKCKKCVFVGKTVYYYFDIREESITAHRHKITERLFTDRIPLLKSQIQILQEAGREDLAEYQICIYYEELLNTYVSLRNQKKDSQNKLWANRIKHLLLAERKEMIQSIHFTAARKKYKLKIIVFTLSPTLFYIYKSSL